MLRQFAILIRDCQTQIRFLVVIQVCQPRPEYCMNTKIQKSREEKHRGGEEADKKEAIHYSY